MRQTNNVDITGGGVEPSLQGASAEHTLLPQIEQAKQEWERTFDAIQDLISLHSNDYRILRVNRALADKLGTTPQALIGRKCYEVFHCREAPWPGCPHEQTLQTRAPASIDVDDPQMGGFFHMSTFPLFTPDGELYATVHVARDLTQRRAMEAQLIQSAKMASLGTMAGGIAHEIRNPLCIISAAAQLLREYPDDEKLRDQSAKKIHRAAQRASHIIEMLLRFARPAVERRESVAVNGALEEALSLVGATALRQRDIALKTHLAGELPAVQGNRSLLQQVFVNVLTNAAQAMPDGGALTVSTGANSAGQVEIAIADTGPGIPAGHLDKIFDPFFTAWGGGSGTGLGLWVSQNIVHEHGGSIEVQSSQGEGTTFVIKLPQGSTVGEQ